MQQDTAEATNAKAKPSPLEKLSYQELTDRKVALIQERDAVRLPDEAVALYRQLEEMKAEQDARIAAYDAEIDKAEDELRAAASEQHAARLGEAVARKKALAAAEKKERAKTQAEIDEVDRVYDVQRQLAARKKAAEDRAWQNGLCDAIAEDNAGLLDDLAHAQAFLKGFRAKMDSAFARFHRLRANVTEMIPNSGRVLPQEIAFALAANEFSTRTGYRIGSEMALSKNSYGSLKYSAHTAYPADMSWADQERALAEGMDWIVETYRIA